MLLKRLSSRLGKAMLVVSLLGLSLSGCQSAPSVSARKLFAHQALLNLSGLGQRQRLQAVNASAAVPASWSQAPLQRKALYTHMHWKSPTRDTGFGIAHVRLPIPIGPVAMVWLARQEYAKGVTGSPGKVLGEWTDSAGRRWFEAENDRYHVRGYCVTDGFDGWLVYSGYKLHSPANAMEMNLATRAVETVRVGKMAE